MKNNYIKSPLNYQGGKYKLLPIILPMFPSNISTFVDLFGGGFNVGINVDAEHIIYNDICEQVVTFLKYMKNNNIEDILSKIDSHIQEYQLTKENRDGYLQLREIYNTGTKTPDVFYTLLCYSFNNQIRFNSKGEYNMPFGKNRSSFNPTLRQKFIDFHNKLNEIDCRFLNKSFECFDFSNLTEHDFVYIDPPYYNSIATYNENGGWTETKETLLLNTLDSLNNQGVKFALSNNLKYNNPILDNWKDKYHVHYLNYDYSNCNYQKKDKSKDCEVLITNY